MEGSKIWKGKNLFILGMEPRKKDYKSGIRYRCDTRQNYRGNQGTGIYPSFSSIFNYFELYIKFTGLQFSCGQTIRPYANFHLRREATIIIFVQPAQIINVVKRNFRYHILPKAHNGYSIHRVGHYRH